MFLSSGTYQGPDAIIQLASDVRAVSRRGRGHYPALWQSCGAFIPVLKKKIKDVGIHPLVMVQTRVAPDGVRHGSDLRLFFTMVPWGDGDGNAIPSVLSGHDLLRTW